VTGLAIYNSTILDIAFPPFVFKKLLASIPLTANVTTSTPRLAHGNTLEDLAELRPALARGLRQLLEYDGNVQETFCRDFVVEEDRYGENVQVWDKNQASMCRLLILIRRRYRFVKVVKSCLSQILTVANSSKCTFITSWIARSVASTNRSNAAFSLFVEAMRFLCSDQKRSNS
jgi:HECT-domain (ubiquitin-transferase)